MPIAIAFTVTAALAMVGLIYIQRELTLNFMAVRGRRRNGLSIETSWMLLVLLSIISSTNALLLIVGVGALAGIRWIGYLLAVIPLIKLSGTLLVLRSLRKQAEIFRASK